jgi:hypothetical protein
MIEVDRLPESRDSGAMTFLGHFCAGLLTSRASADRD